MYENSIHLTKMINLIKLKEMSVFFFLLSKYSVYDNNNKRLHTYFCDNKCTEILLIIVIS